MGKVNRKFSREFKLSVIKELESGKTMGQVCREYRLHEQTVSRWRKQYREKPEKAFMEEDENKMEKIKVLELERTVGKLYLENEFLKKTLKGVSERLQDYRREGRER